ncbi:MAG: bifunctional folylpolyglutamate synthase/dihydrofolate synthase [Peptostreptococcaceae bacterium]|nr:bifunctional folylpolyglutamate synthase/dihydrofolate synthase [Peptostreptococcaceae bacterium]
MNYNEAKKYIDDSNRFGSVLGLDRIKYLLKLLGNPQDNLKIIHVAGTNGKGSTCSFINSILLKNNYNVGLYTSPYLEEFEERIRFNNENIKKEDIASIITIIKSKIDIMLQEGFNSPTEFEIVTAMAFYYYNMKKVDFLVLEVGLGGRFDATNVIKKPLLSVITPVGIDHVAILGDNISKIAYEKAGIIKDDGITIIHPQESDAYEVIKDICDEKNNKLIEIDEKNINIKKLNSKGQSFLYKDNLGIENNLEIKMLGKHQIRNSILAFECINILKTNYKFKFENESIKQGLKEAFWAGRAELIDSKILLDGAHNLHGAKALKAILNDYFKDYKIKLVIGMLKDKDVKDVMNLFLPIVDEIITTKPLSDRALSAEELKEIILKIDKTKDIIAINDIKSAIEKKIYNIKEKEILIIAGSLYLVGNARTILRKDLKIL